MRTLQYTSPSEPTGTAARTEAPVSASTVHGPDCDGPQATSAAVCAVPSVALCRHPTSTVPDGCVTVAPEAGDTKSGAVGADCLVTPTRRLAEVCTSVP